MTITSEYICIYVVYFPAPTRPSPAALQGTLQEEAGLIRSEEKIETQVLKTVMLEYQVYSNYI